MNSRPCQGCGPPYWPWVPWSCGPSSMAPQGPCRAQNQPTPGASLFNFCRTRPPHFPLLVPGFAEDNGGLAFALCCACRSCPPRASCSWNPGLDPGHPGGQQLEDSGPEAEGRLVGSSEDRGSLGPGPSLWAGHHGAFSALGSHTESHEGCPACLLAPVPWAEDPNPLVLGRNNRVVLCKPCSVLRGAASGQPGPVILTLLEGTAEVGTPRHSRPRTVTFDFNERPCS